MPGRAKPRRHFVRDIFQTAVGRFDGDGALAIIEIEVAFDFFDVADHVRFLLHEDGDEAGRVFLFPQDVSRQRREVVAITGASGEKNIRRLNFFAELKFEIAEIAHELFRREFGIVSQARDGQNGTRRRRGQRGRGRRHRGDRNLSRRKWYIQQSERDGE